MWEARPQASTGPPNYQNCDKVPIAVFSSPEVGVSSDHPQEGCPCSNAKSRLLGALCFGSPTLPAVSRCSDLKSAVPASWKQRLWIKASLLCRLVRKFSRKLLGALNGHKCAGCFPSPRLLSSLEGKMHPYSQAKAYSQTRLNLAQGLKLLLLAACTGSG